MPTTPGRLPLYLMLSSSVSLALGMYMGHIHNEDGGHPLLFFTHVSEPSEVGAMEHSEHQSRQVSGLGSSFLFENTIESSSGFFLWGSSQETPCCLPVQGL